MAIGVIATIPVQEGKNDEFEAVFMELAAQVLANEPGCKFYALNRSKSDPQVYKVLESYEDQAALEAHGQTDYFKAANVKLAGLVGGRPDIAYLDGVEWGFLLLATNYLILVAVSGWRRRRQPFSLHFNTLSRVATRSVSVVVWPSKSKQDL